MADTISCAVLEVVQASPLALWPWLLVIFAAGMVAGAGAVYVTIPKELR